MKTNHKIIFGDSRDIGKIASNSVDLMITSPPYPMIEMWDKMFGEQNSEITEALNKGNGRLAFELMNKELDKAWNEVYRVLKNGGFACINIGDAVRTINKNFELYSNHSRILTHCLSIGFQALPEILWRKQTNSPNKFMGSGMLPPGAYVTLEHEHIIILRKGNKREFLSSNEKLNRQKSSFFWEERNILFSDMWEGLKGASQKLTDEKIRDRSAAFPFELAYRLICMFSMKGDVIFDPYLGTATTTLAAIASGRNSVGVEIDHNFDSTIHQKLVDAQNFSNEYIKDRIKKHLDFVNERTKTKGDLGYKNVVYDFPVMTRQELEIVFNEVQSVNKINEDEYEIIYNEHPRETKVASNEPEKRKNRSSEKIEETLPELTSEQEIKVIETLKKFEGLVSREGAIKMVKLSHNNL